MDRIDYLFDGKRFVINPHTFIISYAYIVNVYVDNMCYQFGFNEDSLYDDLKSNESHKNLDATVELNFRFMKLFNIESNE